MTTEAKPTSVEFSIKIDGSKILPDFLDQISEVEVETSQHLPDMFTLRVHLDATGEKPFDIVDNLMKNYLNDGKKVEIFHHVNKHDSLIMDGEITSVSLELSAVIPGSPVYAVIQGYDKSHRLHRGRSTRTFINSKYSDVVKIIASEANLKADVTATKEVHDYLLQTNQTNWEFLWQMAKRVGYEVHMDQGTLNFKNPKGANSGQVDLEWGSSLLQFRSRHSTASQVNSVSVRGWDPKQKKEIVGQSTKGEGYPALGDARSGMVHSKNAFGDTKLVIVDQPVYTQGEADTIAKAMADATEGEFVVAEGTTAEGMPSLRPGVKAHITGIGQRLSGDYFVTSATHRFSVKQGYTTSFVVSGQRSYTLLELMESKGNSNSVSHGGGVTSGVVTNNQDPDDFGRVKVKFPWLGDDIESDWAWVASPGAGKDRGIQWIPEVEDTVLVAFEYGDIQRPYIVGGVWNSVDTPVVTNSEAVSGGAVNQRIIKSRAGHVIVLDDTDGAEKIIVRDKTEKNEIIIDSVENTVTVNVEKDIKVTAKGKVTVESTGDMELKSSANLKLEATANIEIKAGANTDVEAGAAMNMKGAQTTVEGSAQMAVKGATTSVEGSAMTEVKGGIVRIN